MSNLQTKLKINSRSDACCRTSPQSPTPTARSTSLYVETLGFEKVVDVPMGPDMRWVEVALPGTATTIALAPPPQGQEAGGSQTGICLDTTDVDGDHAALAAAGVARMWTTR